MTNPYTITILVYLFFAIIVAFDASLTSFQLIPWANGIRWIRIHMVTLGILTQLIFAYMPALVSQSTNQPRPKFRWDIWLMLNVGILSLLYGIPLVNFPAILTGGTLIFVAASILIHQLSQMRKTANGDDDHNTAKIHDSRKFYIAGLSYFLLGIIIGTGLWMGWPALLRMNVPLEVHIHANNWGLMSLVFAGLLVDLFPKISGRSLAWPRSVAPIFWMMTVGALGLTLGPWFSSLYFTVPGILLHLAATGWLLANIIKPLCGDRSAWTPGLLHLVVSYFWILAPVLAAPFVILGISGGNVEASAPQGLIYGWVLQFGIALLPYFFRRALHPEQDEHQLGGTWFSLLMVNLGGVFLWASIFIRSSSEIIHGIAYILWAVAMLPSAKELYQIFKNESVQGI